jgi:hypothetical protein
MDYLASMFIDDELSLGEKIGFVDRIQSDPPFYRDTRALLLQEQMLRIEPDASQLPARPPMAVRPADRFRMFYKPAVYALAGFACAVLMLWNLDNRPPTALRANRFIIYEPAADNVELIGSFTGWQRTPMKPIGTSGYWELQLSLPTGEHRFAYILDGNRQKADPTLPIREMDDFGGENSILNVGENV